MRVRQGARVGSGRPGPSARNNRKGGVGQGGVLIGDLYTPASGAEWTQIRAAEPSPNALPLSSLSFDVFV